MRKKTCRITAKRKKKAIPKEFDWTEWFRRFWEKKYPTLSLNNPQRLRDNLLQKLERVKDAGDIEEYVHSLRQGKETTRRIFVEFFRFLEDEAGVEVESSLLTERFFNYSFERQLEIAKYLSEPRTTSEIAAHFHLDERTARDDLQCLEDGIEVLGTVVRVERQRKGRAFYYKCTMHPVFLPLNLTEVYAMTVYLENVLHSQNTNEYVIQGVIDRIKSQLSDYAFDKLYPGQSRPQGSNGFVSDELLARSREGLRMYLMKSGELCKFVWEDKEYRGRIVFDHAFKEYRIQTEEGQVLPIRPEEAEFVIESVVYR